MNWKKFKNIVLDQNKNLCFIDRQKTNRGINEIRLLRFFFCGKFKPFVEQYNAIGIYVIIEKSYYHKDYDLGLWFIDVDTQKTDRCFFRIGSFKAENCYNEAVNKIKELLKVEV